MSLANKYWLEEIFNDKLNEEGNFDVKMRSHATSSGIAPLDISTIKHIYEKALLISKLEEEAQNNELDFEVTSKFDEFASNFESMHAVKLDPHGKGAANGLTSSPSSYQIAGDNKPQDNNPWSPTEIQTVRQQYVKTKEENSRLRLLLNVREEELSLLREKYKNQESELQQVRCELQDVRRANDSLTFDAANKRDDTQQTQLHKRIGNLEQDLKYCQDGRNRMAKEVLRLEKDFNLEREARAKLETSLHAVIQEKQHDILFLEENWKSLHKNEVGRLKRIIDELNQKLSREEEIRRCVQMGLDSLQRHFMRTSPPSEGSPHTPTKMNKLNF